MDTAAEEHRDRATPVPHRTEPVSFIRRGGRLKGRQQRAWDDLAATHVVEVPRHGPSTSVDPEFRLDVTITVRPHRTARRRDRVRTR